ncbi:pirin family protein [Roseateles violae]|uniref:Pirin family protein n=1 Tax=Roseateles violae TaxID=3058042 RepID=A0ABT8DS15_9BURK|nr:pirin-like bicupin family protein [Pelomonas sp. PFR6]MDN3919714.1 pirin family protein [Pelomonas sp. PFR6]
MADIFHDRQARGWSRTGWLQAYYTFSFGSFNDPTRMGFRALRVINEDIIAGGSGFSEHAHDHFEILSFMLAGELEHQDSAGNKGRLQAGDVQLISSGTGIKHSERNPAPEASTHLFQIWLHGDADDHPPRYQLLKEALLNRGDKAGPRLVASTTEQPGALQLRAPVNIWAAAGQAGDRCAHQVAAGRYAWLQLLEGIVVVEVEGEAEPLELRGGDALQLATVSRVAVSASTAARWLWFDLA